MLKETTLFSPPSHTEVCWGGNRQPVTQAGAETKGGQFMYQILWDDSVEHGAEIQEQHPHVCFSPPDVLGSDGVQRRWYGSNVGGSLETMYYFTNL